MCNTAIGPLCRAQTITMVTAVSVKQGWFYECLTELPMGDTQSPSILGLSALIPVTETFLLCWKAGMKQEHYLRVSLLKSTDILWNFYRDIKFLSSLIVLRNWHGCLSGLICWIARYLTGQFTLKPKNTHFPFYLLCHLSISIISLWAAEFLGF